MAQTTQVTPVILSGGSGTRLWPLSTPEKPKQFLDLFGPLSMFQLTLQRCADESIYRKPLIVGSSGHIETMQDQMMEVGATPSTIILEPCPRNTAPAIALAALAAESPSDLLLVMPSDHMIKNLPEFQSAVVTSMAIAQSGWLVTFGIEPTGPETGYGYIQQGEAIAGTTKSFSVTRFVEKPTKQNAEKMLADGGYHWNAGIFLFRADIYLAAVEKYAPEILLACQSAMAGKQMEDERCYPESEAFASAPSDSIDYAIMERAETVAVTPVNPGWSDVGSWDALFDISNKDDQSNVIIGQALTIGSTSNLIHSHDLEITVFGVDDLIIVSNENKVMILPRGQSQNVKKIAQKLEEEG
ncbi:MAG: mannose-1-phosphate guanylyltransferase/mannose-6-phosphate isomerase [Sphingomonadales bacterium]|nr:mannose-1-phosphate guanylyltransferase/mannose-6-phosphate isomerase [Sphingomonadales bacterium]PIX67305.1 MAG: mannose-1-phosphate guanylyltransferase/mannose-6-phosphate isomerase [Sphingomonadales bacterium CG_4_10_14_3_um_filter_58_15]NCO48887.1 mannose-1-phosphate guanylyltransferase/mannose-6-phosphate isomerase [Sphingomonadales bacterium]NCO99354.1 mannose-1-phosphate guanylyltransferase/mannose-6-phosphate isomerase [Sphingomonadales bacterium]NCP26979.1 mannose-1-phosphate guanyl